MQAVVGIICNIKQSQKLLPISRLYWNDKEQVKLLFQEFTDFQYSGLMFSQTEDFDLCD